MTIAFDNLFSILRVKIMLKKQMNLALVVLILNFAFSSFVFAQDTDARVAQKIKIRVAEIGTGGKLIEVKYKNKTKIKGYITEIKDDNFVLVSKETGASTNISYGEVKSINRLSPTSRKVGLAIGIGLLTFGIIGAIASLGSLK